jgi:hypothetical protein
VCKPLNQDFHGAVVPKDALLATKGMALALADGISSSPVSQVASAAAVRGFLEDYYATSEPGRCAAPPQRVLGRPPTPGCIRQTMRGEGRFDKDRGYVCTFSALVFKGREAHLLHVGDTRIYRLHPQALEQLTEDHRVRLSETESYLGQALGMALHVEIDYRALGGRGGRDLPAGHRRRLRPPGRGRRARRPGRHHGTDLDAAARALVAAGPGPRQPPTTLTLQLLRVDALPPSRRRTPAGLSRDAGAAPVSLRPAHALRGLHHAA